MKYFELSFKITHNNEAAADVLAALLADAGCETFVPTDEGLTAYVQQSLYDQEAIQSAAANLSTLLPDCSVSFTCAQAPDENWNATWEAEHHFQPIDLPDGQQLQIIPRQAFGSGEHATTRLMLQLLATKLTHLSSPTVIDAGCGTGVLGIAAIKLGAAHVFAYDIDEWSVRNAQDNFALNGIDAIIPEAEGATTAAAVILEGDAHVLQQAPLADLLLANINRNILLADLPTFVSRLKPGGNLLLSGFYEADVPPLVHRAESLGLTLVSTHAEGDWCALEFNA